MKPVTASVYAEDQFSVPPNCRGSNWGFLVTPGGIVMIDTPMVPRTAVQWRKEIAKKGEVRYIINTHHHVDHVTGNFFFPGPVISHEATREGFFAPLANVAGSERVEEAIKIGRGTMGYIRLLVGEHDPESLPLLDEEHYYIKSPTITFSKELTLYLANQVIKLIHQPGHTGGQIGVYLPEKKVLFTGDNFCNGTQPSLAHSFPLEWVESLKQMEAMEVERVVPGHGEICDRQEVSKFRQFIELCIEKTRTAIQQGKSREEAADTISFEDLYPLNWCRSAVHPGGAMQRKNVFRLYEMLSKYEKQI